MTAQGQGGDDLVGRLREQAANVNNTMAAMTVMTQAADRLEASAGRGDVVVTEARAREVLLENMLAKPWAGDEGLFWKAARVTPEEAIAAMLAFAAAPSAPDAEGGGDDVDTALRAAHRASTTLVEMLPAPTAVGRDAGS